MDDDDHVSEACDGDDCDDTRGNVFAGATEICDAVGIDEDCVDDTLGTDGDGDGAYDPACCYQPPDGAAVCGTDCDDGDDAIGPDAAERSNGVDDDCDTMIDEDFECVQSQVVSQCLRPRRDAALQRDVHLARRDIRARGEFLHLRLLPR